MSDPTSRKLREFFVLILLVKGTIFYVKSEESDTFPWHPKGWNGDILYCPKSCNMYSYPLLDQTRDGCCACNAKHRWANSEPVLMVDISLDGYLTGNSSARNIHVTFVQKYLQFFPKNSCQFPGITHIDMSFNLLIGLPDISCLQNLSYLDLSWNKISYFPNTLTRIRNLRTLNISHNSITHLETGVLASLSAHNIILQGNEIISIDITDVVFERVFCEIDMSHNALMMPTNDNNWHVNHQKTYGPGFVDFSFNNITRMVNTTKMGFRNVFGLSKLFRYGFDFRHNPIICDCKIVKLLIHCIVYIDIMDRDFFSITCGSPGLFYGKTVPSIIKNKEIKDLICNYTSTSMCLDHCVCEERPENLNYRFMSVTLTLVINCTGVGLKRLPTILPYSDNIEFHMRGNMIREVSNKHYLRHVTVLDLEIMPVFSNNAIKNLTHLQVFSVPRSEQRKGIPRELSLLNPCVFLQREDFVMICTCDQLWMSDWIHSSSSSQCASFVFKCLNGTVEENFTSYLSRLSCSKKEGFEHYDWLLIMCFCVVFLCVCIVVSVYRYELQIKFRNRKTASTSNKSADQDCAVYISYDGNDIGNIDSWIFNILEPFLTGKGIRTFVPSRDLSPGGVRAEEAACQIAVSRYYLVILSESYCNKESIMAHNEWRNIWNHYISDPKKKLLVINFDLMTPSEVPCRQLAAFLRVGNVVNFAEGATKTFSQILMTFVENI